MKDGESEASYERFMTTISEFLNGGIPSASTSNIPVRPGVKMNDGRIKLVTPAGEERILKCAITVDDMPFAATAVVWRDAGGMVAGISFLVEDNKKVGFAVAFPAVSVELFCQMLKMAVKNGH